MNIDKISFTPIGVVESCFRDRFGTPRQSDLIPAANAKIKIYAKFQPEFSLQGLEGFSHIWVMFVFHKNTNVKFSAKVHPPRMDGQTIGLFATRSPHRPNPIGLSLVKLESVGPDYLEISGHDIVDGSPVLDIKPYLSLIEAKPTASQGWTEDRTKGPIEVRWSKRALECLAEFACDDSFKSLADQTLAQDPRPMVYKGYEGQESPRRSSHAIRLHDLDVHFTYPNPTTVEVTEIKRFPVLF